jgi:hypothetical protein
MLVFAMSDKGGTGRTVTSSNILYRRALQGHDACYLDFDFGSPTAGSVFQVPRVARGTTLGGLHQFLQGTVELPDRVDVWAESEQNEVRPPGGSLGELVLYPGDVFGGEFSTDEAAVRRCASLFLRLEEQFEISMVDLSAGRSYAADVALAATARPELAGTTCRWLVFHRWTHQHVTAAADLIFGSRGIIEAGVQRGHDKNRLVGSLRLVRTAVVDPNGDDLTNLRATQVAWLRECNSRLQRLAGERGIGRTRVLGTVPFDPMLQWREQLVSDDDVLVTQVANTATVEAFDALGQRLAEEAVWETL